MQSTQRTRRRRNGRRRNGRFRGLRTSHTTRVQELTNLLPTGDFVPPALRTQLTFSFERDSAASTSIGNIQFTGNGIFDPSGSSGANKPVAFNQLAALYNRYRVIGSSIEVRAVVRSTSNAPVDTLLGGDMIVYPSTVNTSPTSLEDAVSQPYARNRQIIGTYPTVIKNAASTSALTGQREMKGSDRLQAAISADPADIWYWIVAFKSDQNYTNGNFNFITKVVYDVEFFDRAYIGLSTLTAKYLQLAYEARCQELSPKKEKKEAPRESKDSKENRPIMTTSDGRAFVRCDDPTAGVDWIEVRTPAPIRLPQESGKR